ncbi:MAG: phytoene desaturase family protein [Bacteroidales bacterium]|nr:phytoene desaturase family protein [Bacteroidales bacterium]
MKVGIVGSGIGGLSTACRLAAKGHDVTVFEKNSRPGGKINEIRADGYRFDTGASLFTLPGLIEDLTKELGLDNQEKFSYRKLDVLCKYFYNDKTSFTAYANRDKFIAECLKLGENEKKITRYLKKVEKLYQLTADIFIFRSLHKISNFLRWKVFTAFLQVYKIEFYRSMHASNIRSFRNSKLVRIFDRYGTYNGSNPYKAPATLNVIAHLENNLGGWFPNQGMYSLVTYLFEAAKQLGVKFNFETEVTKVLTEKKQAKGVIANGKEISFDKLVINTDVNYVVDNMMDKHPLKNRLKRAEPSTSALVFYWGIKREFPEVDFHNILFSDNYKEEFNKLFVEKQLQDDPTIYIFVSSRVVKTDAPEGCENWFVMINTPSITNQNWDEFVKQARQKIVAKINKTLNTDIEQYFETENVSSPLTLRDTTLSANGSLYGNSSNSMLSAFMRHPNFLSRIKNIYFVGGSVHPGGGIPLCLAGSKIVADEFPHTNETN